MNHKVEVKERLDRLLARLHPEISRTRWEKLIAASGVLIDGAEVKQNGFNVMPGMVVDYEAPLATPIHDLTPVAIDFRVAYEDEHLIVVVKPRGLSVHPSPTSQEPTLVHGLIARGQGLSEGSEPYRPGIVHRLDKDTTGLLIVAKTDESHLKLSGMIREKSVERFYIAFGYGRPPHPRFTVDAPIGRHPTMPLLMAIRTEGKPATTHFRLLKEAGQGCQVVCKLDTGRTHQIRVHLSSVGMPVKGDRLYARAPWGTGALQLHAARLIFIHPFTGQEIDLYEPPPEDFELREFVLEADMTI